MTTYTDDYIEFKVGARSSPQNTHTLPIHNPIVFYCMWSSVYCETKKDAGNGFIDKEEGAQKAVKVYSEQNKKSNWHKLSF